MNQIWLETSDSAQWHNADQPIVSVADRGFTYGDGVFETIRVREGQPLFLGRHLQRLRSGSERLMFPPWRWTEAELVARCVACLAQNSANDGVLKIVLTRGAGRRGFAPSADAKPVLVIQVGPVPPPFEKLGFSAVLAPWKIDAASPLCSLKSLSALDKVLAKHWAREQGADEMLFQNLHGHLAEAAAWNLFVVSRGQVSTPALHCGVLPGITRALLLETTAVVEAELPVEALAQADEAFLTNAVSGVQPLVSFSGLPIGAGQPGPITAAMAAHYQTLEQTEINYLR